MTSERWQQIEHLLDEVLARPEEARAAFLDEACADDAALRLEVDVLLTAEDVALPFLDADAAAFAAPALTTLPAEAATAYIGQHLGVYRLVRQIGMGGMGLVYLAERDDEQFSKQVAIKFLRHPGRHPDLVARLRSERQILASLSHRHIAQVFDGGVTTGGWPYLVMEYIDGQAITDYCEARTVSLHECLALIEQVAEAVQHAHQRLIVHRDLKPSNILVTEDDAGHPHVKLLDFGIAKLLDEETAGVPRTGTGLRLMTPQYAAPEQIRGQAVTTATDVYALGVVLYELLTGQRPYTLEGKTASEVEQIVCEQEPTRPSTAVLADENDTVVVERRNKQLRGDLDIIVMKALRKEPEMRYVGVGELLEDLRRYRSGLPVLAREATVGYRVRKFASRHRVGVAMAAVLVVLVLGFAVAMAAQQQATARERDRAQVAAQKASAVTDFMLDLFQANEPDAAPTDTITARTLLARGRERVGAMESQPEVQAEMLIAIGEAYRRLGSYDRAEPLLREAVALMREQPRSTQETLAKSLSRLGVLLTDQGKYEAAETHHREALAIRQRLFGEHHRDVVASMGHLGSARQEQGDFAMADSLIRKALALSRELPGDHNQDVLALMNNMVLLLGGQGHFAAAESLQREVLVLRRQVLGNAHINVAGDLNNIGYLLTRQGRYDEAERFYREALAIKREVLGNEHPEVAKILGNLATLKGRAGDYDAAEPLLREALALWKRIHGEKHPSVATQMNNLAVLISRKGDVAAAAELQREVLALRRETSGNEHPAVAVSLANLAISLLDLKAYAEAERLVHEALRINRKVYGEQHDEIASNLSILAEAKRLQGVYPQAIALRRESLAMWRALNGDSHPDVAVAMKGLGMALRDQGQYAESDSLLRAAVAIQRSLLGDDHTRVAETLDELGVSLMRRKRYPEAETCFQEALAIRRAKLGDRSSLTRQSLQHLIELYNAWEQPNKAAPYQALLIEE